jgi:Glycosyl hydrolases family 35
MMRSVKVGILAVGVVVIVLILTSLIGLGWKEMNEMKSSFANGNGGSSTTTAATTASSQNSNSTYDDDHHHHNNNNKGSNKNFTSNKRRSATTNTTTTTTTKAPSSPKRPVVVRTVHSRPSFPSYLDYHHHQNDYDSSPPPILVSYNRRSLLLNGQPVLLLGGSVHAGWRVTQGMWENAMDNAVRQGFNLITMYLFWNSHQFYPQDESFTFTYPTQSIQQQQQQQQHYPNHNNNNNNNDDESQEQEQDDEWSVASAIRSAGQRGLFVHLRLGPYVCAEYNNGGIPEWLPLVYPNMTLRHYDDANWKHVMRHYLNTTVTYLRSHQLWAYQGGNILLAQVENEIPSSRSSSSRRHSNKNNDHVHDHNNDHDDDDDGDDEDDDDPQQQYADWCGQVAYELEPNVTWTMCNGLSSPQTLSTCNGPSGKCIAWIERNGDTGRIQMNQPALLTEFQGGFQTWGETSQHPSIYFWGVTAREKARYALKWLARGGSHLNYYMWFGGYNRGRSSGGGITNMYANDVAVCSSGERHEPKFSHFVDLHTVVADVACVLVHSETALHKSHPVEYWNDTVLAWQVGMDQRLFVYPSSSALSFSGNSSSDGGSNGDDGESDRRVVAFLENDSETNVLVRIPTIVSSGEDAVLRVFNMTALSVIVLVDGIPRFDSAVIQPKHTHFERQVVVDPDNSTLVWSYSAEPIGASSALDDNTVRSTRPIEQTALHVQARTMTSDYSWYETDFVVVEDVPATIHRCTLSIVTRRQMALSAWIDGTIYMGSVLDHSTGMEVNVTLTIDYDVVGGLLLAGPHTLTILSESLGYLAYPGASTQGKAKGITGDVVLVTFYHGPTSTKTTNTNNSNTRTNNKDNAILYNITQNLVDGREWRSYPSLHGEAEENSRIMRHNKGPTSVLSTTQTTKRSLARLGPKSVSSSSTSSASSLSSSFVSPTWLVASFRTPTYDPTRQALFLEITRGRGHLWLNGNDLGRYWNITRGDGDDTLRQHSQQYYFLPHDFLYHQNTTANENEIVLFDATMTRADFYNDTRGTPRLVLSWIEESNTSTLLDEVDFPSACLL